MLGMTKGVNTLIYFTYWDVNGGGPLEFHNFQEIVDIELMFELICMFFKPQRVLSNPDKRH